MRKFKEGTKVLYIGKDSMRKYYKGILTVSTRTIVSSRRVELVVFRNVGSLTKNFLPANSENFKIAEVELRISDEQISSTTL